MEIIRLHIDAGETVDLLTLTKSLAAIATNYARFAKARGFQKASLSVKEVSHGSIIVDLIGSVANGLCEGIGGHMSDYLKYLGILIGKIRKGDTDGVTSKEAIEVRDMTGVIDGSPNGGIRITQVGEENRTEVNIVCSDAAAATKVAQALSVSCSSLGFERQCELLYLTRIDKDEATVGNRGVIESISPKSLPVIFTGDIHQRIFEAGDPFRKCYIVDVVVQTVNGAPGAYKVTRLHDISDIEA